MQINIMPMVALLFAAAVVSACNKPSDQRSVVEPVAQQPATDQTNVAGQSPLDGHVFENIVNFKVTTVKENNEDLAYRPKWFFWYFRTTFQNGVEAKNMLDTNKAQGQVFCEAVWSSKFFRNRKRFKQNEVITLKSANTSWSALTSAVRASRGTTQAKDGARVREFECIKFGTAPLTVGDVQRAFGDFVRIEPR